jgi:bifunctional non-homologous end joining protein LigD
MASASYGKCFFMKRTPSPSPEWLETCEIMHKSENLIAFPMVQDLGSLLWVVNLGCIDLNPWYARCDDVDRPDYLHFDLDPVPGAGLDRVLETAIIVRDALRQLGMAPLAKTSGSKGMHIYVPIVRGPLQKDVWRFAKALAKGLEQLHPDLITAEYRRSSAAWPGAGGLQPERLGPDPCLDLLGATHRTRHRLDPGDLG